MPYNLVDCRCFHTKNSAADFLREQYTFRGKMVNLCFRAPLRGLGATYAVHLRVIEKLVGDFLLVIIELFSLGAFVLSQFTRLTDRQTDRRTARRTDARRKDRVAYNAAR